MGAVAVFQEAQNICFDTNLKLYGQDATWVTTDGELNKDIVLFNDPTREVKLQVINGRVLNHVGYDNTDIVSPYIEYRNGQYEGLWELVYEGMINQFVETGGKLYVTKHTTSFWDGQTYRIQLQPTESSLVILNMAVQ